MGAFAGAFLFAVMLASSLGIRGAEVVAALVSLAGLALTTWLLPEPRGKSLEELSAQAYDRPGADPMHPGRQTPDNHHPAASQATR